MKQNGIGIIGFILGFVLENSKGNGETLLSNFSRVSFAINSMIVSH